MDYGKSESIAIARHPVILFNPELRAPWNMRTLECKGKEKPLVSENAYVVANPLFLVLCDALRNPRNVPYLLVKY